MALDQSALLELLEVMRSADGGELMRRLLATILQLLVDAEATAFVGAEPHERSVARTNRRNGTRDKLVATPGRSSRRCSRRGGGWTWRCTRW